MHTTFSLSPTATALLTELRKWVASLPPASVVIRENPSQGYGGLLFEIRPKSPGAMRFSVGLGSSHSIDFFWGDGYRWENWNPSPNELLSVCEAIRTGDVLEEIWKIGSFVIERRCYIRRAQQVGDGSPQLPAWIKRLARRFERKYNPWGEAA